jgi:hypothetical protein
MTTQVDQYGAEAAVVHYVHQRDPERIACMPGLTELHQTQQHPAYRRTDDHRVVSCQHCRRSIAWRLANGEVIGLKAADAVARGHPDG